MRSFPVVVVLAFGACSSESLDLVPSAEDLLTFVAPATTAPPPPPVRPPPVAARLAAAAPAEAAFALTASDGTGLRVAAIDAKAVVEGPLAFTELHLDFDNPEPRVREGTFAITLPERAAVSRFAVDTGGELIEAEVVPKALARRAYDDAVHRGIDPAILEKGAGNQFTGRVFPIPAHGVVHVVVSYSQELAGEGYRLPLRGLPAVDRVAVSLDGLAPDGSRQVQRLRQDHWQPDADFTATVASPPAVGAAGLVVGAFDISPGQGSGNDADAPTSLTLLVDTSASRAAGFTRYLDRVGALVDALADRYDHLQLDVVAFDQETHRAYTGAASGFGSAALAALDARDAAGASNLAAALATLAATPHRRVVIVTDAVVTAGDDGAELTADVAKLELDRVDVALAGGIRDDHTAAALARAGRRPGDVFDLDAGIDPVAEGLGEAVHVDVPVAVAGATWSYPKVVPSLRAHTQLLVLARFARPASALEVTVGGVSQRASVTGATPALLGRAIARAEIDEREARLDATPVADVDAAAALRRDIAARSVAARVVSSQTAMLVLASDDEYARYGIDRRALADVLVIGVHGVEPRHRSSVATAEHVVLHDDDPSNAPQRAREQAVEQARGAGMLGPPGGGPDSRQGFASLSSSGGDVTSGFDETNVYGGMTGEGQGASGGGGTAMALDEGKMGKRDADGYGAAGASGGEGHGAGHLASRHVAVPTITISQPRAEGSLAKNMLRRYIHRHTEQLRHCYEFELQRHPDLAGTIQTQFLVHPDGTVSDVTASGFDHDVATCVAGVIATIEFPAGASGVTEVHYPFTFVSPEHPGDDASASDAAVAASDAATAPVPAAPLPPSDPPPPPRRSTPDAPIFGPPIDALDGNLAHVVGAITHGAVWDALAFARRWHAGAPGDVLAWVGVGLALEANGQRAEAARAYGSIIDLYASQASYRRFAAERLEHLGPAALALAIDSLRRAVADRPDQITGHRLLAYALVRARDLAGAWQAIRTGADQEERGGSYRGAPRVFADDVRIIAAAYAAHGGDRDAIALELARRNLDIPTGPSTRVLLYWETDANDVDLHVTDAHGNHSFFGHLAMDSGGELYADITTGFGPECFAIEGAPTAGPYELGVHYYRQGPMGYGMGLAQVERFDGKDIQLDDRPYVIMKDDAYVALGRM